MIELSTADLEVSTGGARIDWRFVRQAAVGGAAAGAWMGAGIGSTVGAGVFSAPGAAAGAAIGGAAGAVSSGLLAWGLQYFDGAR